MSIEELSNKGIDSFVNNFVSFISKKAPEFCIAQYKKHEMKLNKGLPEYIKANYQRCAFVRTLLKRDRPTELDKIYEPLQFKIDDDILKEDEIKSSISTDLHRTIISGYAGNGKTIFLKKIYKELIDSQVNFYPIFFELRNISSGIQTLLDCIYESIVTYSDSFTQEQFTYGLKKGLFYFLIDGLDEVSDSQQSNIQEEIIKLTFKYPDCPFVVTSRPNEFTTWENFHVAHLLPFDYRQCQSYITKIDFVEERKTEFLEFLTEYKFAEHEEFLSNPLLASMMLLTFDEYGDIPAKRHIFYEKCFQVLIKEHDASKGRFHRPLKSKLSHENLEKVFMYFCALTYQRQEYSFNFQKVDKYINSALKIVNLDSICKENDIRYDFVHSVSLLLQNGDYFEFIHRSFQEYFFAKLIVNDRKYKLENKLDNIDDLFSFAKLNFIAMIDDMDHDYFETEYVLKKIEKLRNYFKNIDAENEPEKIFERFCVSLGLRQVGFKKYYRLCSYTFASNAEFYKEMSMNWFIMNNCHKYMDNLLNLTIELSASDVLKIINKYKKLFIKINMDEDNTVEKIEFILNRELLIKLDCNRHAQLIKENLNDYYDSILSRITKQRSIMDKEIFKN
ncbi:hypothetical protein CPT77_08255 [Snodgrassella alvi]|uniref:NACHT domain-containing protein n=1 Tax=Snodgrassella alvi TaxID=1196083 RepID=UPI000BBDA5C3|nr:NACHT domain-containing protein [Snodgrassella alvi]PCL20322.1 hypothetical protein CPT77_08255 [Snodgrassella alvi]